eukprot:scaffold175998_cov34-Tisochrysis_lutea.AAC.2
MGCIPRSGLESSNVSLPDPSTPANWRLTSPPTYPRAPSGGAINDETGVAPERRRTAPMCRSESRGSARIPRRASSSWRRQSHPTPCEGICKLLEEVSGGGAVVGIGILRVSRSYIYRLADAGLMRDQADIIEGHNQRPSAVLSLQWRGQWHIKDYALQQLAGAQGAASKRKQTNAWEQPLRHQHGRWRGRRGWRPRTRRTVRATGANRLDERLDDEETHVAELPWQSRTNRHLLR